MTEALLEWQNYRYFPYELDFARLETVRLFGISPKNGRRGLKVPADLFRTDLADRLTYFARAVMPTGDSFVPRQARLEASAFSDGRIRQSTRYSTHGLHEYKGKFNPQVVRAIGNIIGLDKGAWVLDPFCGSGTTLLECAHAGWNSIGVDRNPLAVRIANAKICAFKRSDVLEQSAESIAARVQELTSELSSNTAPTSAVVRRRLGDEWAGDLPSIDYLTRWFATPVLAQIVSIRRVIESVLSDGRDREVFEVILSDHLREVSLQEPADLRIRRRKIAQPNYPLASLFAKAILDRISRARRALRAVRRVRGRQLALFADTRTQDLRSLPYYPEGGFDAVITSPPYETALPYIDTDRLSLVLFKDIDPCEIHRTEKELVGSREIGSRERRDFEAIIGRGDPRLPQTIIKLCQELMLAAQAPGNGFRRLNRPALVLRYFLDMAACFKNIAAALRPGGAFALVVGKNRTVLGGEEFEIDTPNLLVSLARHQGYGVVERRAMDTYQRYEMHNRNSISEEMLIILQRPD